MLNKMKARLLIGLGGLVVSSFIVMMGYTIGSQSVTNHTHKQIQSEAHNLLTKEKEKEKASVLSDELVKEFLTQYYTKEKLAAEFSPEELAQYILALTVQDPDMMPAVEIAREKPLPFKPSGGGFKGKGGNKRGRNDRRGGRDRDRREGGFKRTSNKNRRDFENKSNKRPHRTSSEKKNGFVIRNKGDK